MRYWVALHACPRVQWSLELKEMAKERDTTFPFVLASAGATTGVAEGDALDTRKFTQEQLDALEPSATRIIGLSPRGDY